MRRPLHGKKYKICTSKKYKSDKRVAMKKLVLGFALLIAMCLACPTNRD